jgi:acyl-CoA synthetase (AMP-forming)/AMP-acid ligase II
MWSALMTVPGFETYDLSALELAVTGGAPCPLPVLEYFQGKGVPFQEAFGMTETAPAVTILDADHVKEKNGSIGRPLFQWRLASSTRTTATYQSAMWASSSSAVRTCSGGTGACPTRLPRRFAAAGSTPETWAAWTQRASSRWSTARRT